MFFCLFCVICICGCEFVCVAGECLLVDCVLLCAAGYLCGFGGVVFRCVFDL